MTFFLSTDFFKPLSVKPMRIKGLVSELRLTLAEGNNLLQSASTFSEQLNADFSRSAKQEIDHTFRQAILLIAIAMVAYILARLEYYSVAGSSWDRKAFQLPGLLFQFTVTDVSQVGIPITIAKQLR